AGPACRSRGRRPFRVMSMHHRRHASGAPGPVPPGRARRSAPKLVHRHPGVGPFVPLRAPFGRRYQEGRPPAARARARAAPRRPGPARGEGGSMERCPAEGAARRPSPVRVVLVVGLSLLGVFCLLPYSVWRDGVYDTAALFSAGDVLYDVLSHGFGIDAFPSVVDVFFLASRTATPAARWLAAAFTI